jgi:hypothetical protein
MGSSNKKSGLYVKERLLGFASQNEPIEIKTDAVYGYDEKRLEKYTKSPSPKNLSGLIVEQKQLGAPYSPMPLALSSLYWNAGNDDGLIQVEYEFSKKSIIRTSFQNSIGGNEWSVSRDVITGNFSFRNGKVKGTASMLVRGFASSSDADYTDNLFTVYRNPSPVPIGSLASLREGDGTFARSAFQPNVIGGVYEDQYGSPVLVSYEWRSPTDIPRESIGTYSDSKFFPDNWWNSPFKPDLI